MPAFEFAHTHSTKKHILSYINSDNNLNNCQIKKINIRFYWYKQDALGLKFEPTNDSMVCFCLPVKQNDL